MKHRIKIAPSLLSADFGRLAEEVKQCEEGGADILHVDVMDGHFVPNITIGPLIVEAIRKYSDMEIACHLMITQPERYIQQFVESGANYISVHVEGQVHIHRVIELIHKFGAKAGVALNPGTPIDFAKSIAEFTDFILLMSVNPGFGGQQFIPSFISRAETLRKFLIKRSLKHVEIEVDGGVKIDNVAEIVKAGANMLVCGSGLFNGNLLENIKALRQAAEQANNKI
jgi:ribulose-phosphate 3-epimerase